MSIRVRDYKFFRSLSVKVNDNWTVRKAEQLWRQMRTHKIAGWWNHPPPPPPRNVSPLGECMVFGPQATAPDKLTYGIA